MNIAQQKQIPASLAGFQPTVPFYGSRLAVLVPRSSALVPDREGGRTIAPSLSALAATVSGFRGSAFNREFDTKPTLVNTARKWLVLL